jgi:hypothetical protein
MGPVPENLSEEMVSMNKEAFDLESVYDSEIAPLMTKIIEICNAHKLPMFATFLFANDPDGDDGLCTTNLMFTKERPVPLELLELAKVIGLGSKRPALRIKVKNAAGITTEETVIFP